MSTLAQTAISLRFFGENLNPDEVTAALGVSPTASEKRGDRTTNPKGHIRTALRGNWRYAVPRRTPGDLDAQIEELFEALSKDLTVWRELTEKYDADLFVGLFLDEDNQGISISPTSLVTLSSRRLLLDLDIYRSVPEE